mmetsp:Transcript_17215/g.53793  ORF Transcript_17215/g.53793 Transcript_17215/m.53793 type:complete len:233 (+) Transcript_17215:1488-2186(+)
MGGVEGVEEHVVGAAIVGSLGDAADVAEGADEGGGEVRVGGGGVDAIGGGVGERPERGEKRGEEGVEGGLDVVDDTEDEAGERDVERGAVAGAGSDHEGEVVGGAVLEEELGGVEVEEELARGEAGGEFVEEGEGLLDDLVVGGPVSEVVGDLHDDAVHDGGRVAETHLVEDAHEDALLGAGGAELGARGGEGVLFPEVDAAEVGEEVEEGELESLVAAARAVASRDGGVAV